MKCEKCKKIHKGSYGSGRFCSSKCARSFSTKFKRKEINEKVSNVLKGRENPRKDKLLIERISTNCLQCNKEIIHKITSIRKFCSPRCYSSYTKENKEKENKDSFERYKLDCKFKFNVYDYPNIFNLSLIKKYGWYKAKNKGNNLNGITRDHIYSIRMGFLNKVPAELIAHPVNCNLLRHSDNQRKNTKCNITLKELNERMSRWPND